MNHIKKDYADLRKPYGYPHHLQSNHPHRQLFRRPQDTLVTFSHEFLRLCICLFLVVLAFAVVVWGARV